MNTDLERQIQELQAENSLLRQQLEQKSKLASRALASYQQRALQMEIIRQQNEELDQLAAKLVQAKQLAEEQTAVLESFIENSPVMIFIKDAKDLKFVRWNKANENLVGFKQEEVIGKSDHDFFPKEIADFFVAKDREVLASGQPLDIPEEPVQTATGEVRLLHTRKVPIYGADGEPKYLMGVAEDITERKRIEATLRENEQRYRQILDAITDMVLVKGPQSRIVWANKAFREAYGMTNEQLRDIIDADFVEPDYTQQYIKDDAYVFNSGQVLDIPEEPFTRHDGQILTMHTVKSPLFDVDGRVVGTVGVSRDITERKQIQATLAKRAAELQTVAQVSIAASTTLDVHKLLQEVVDLTKSSFNLYHAHIYLLSETGNTLHLVSGAGEVGQQMVAQGWSIPVEREQSLVAQAARTRQGVIVNDVRLNPDFLPNPLLPLTRSEMAVPMIVGNRVLGVLDVQADSINYFNEEDIRIQTILAAQVAVALQNAQQYGQTEAALAETAWLYQISTQLSAASNIKELFDAAVTPAIASGATSADLIVFQLNESGQPEWAEVVESLEMGPRFPVGTQIYLPESPLSRFPFSELEKVLLVGNTAQDKRLEPALKEMLLSSKIAAGVIMNLLVGQRNIGQIIIGWDTPQLFTESDQRLYDSIATQAATIFDNQLLLEQVQRRAERERLVNAITAKIQATTTIQTALQTTIQELGQAFQARSTQVKVGKVKEASPIRLNGA